MMSPDDQIAAISEMRANYSHIMDALRDMKERIGILPTHADLKSYATQSELSALREVLRTQNEQIEALKRGSPAKISENIQKAALWIVAIGGVVSLFLHQNK